MLIFFRLVVSLCLNMLEFFKAMDTLLQEHDIELSLITLNWFLTLYSSVLHIRIIMRLWDLFLFEGKDTNRKIRTTFFIDNSV